MPLYEYTCRSCGSRFEALVPVSAGAPPCASCGAPNVRREISLFAKPAGSGGPSGASGCACGGACACGR